ncbi:tetratricopeptide repeat protein [Sphingobium yanoikuyae]|uniref:tetratricopeptide repeat protein n=1 Tax=Sphingobium yanoikuyae TaxID=13690 RepID=UPI0035C734E6
MAERLSGAGRLVDAVNLLDQMAEADRRRPQVMFARAVLLIDLGRAGEAEPVLARLINRQPDITRIRLEHGRALAAIGHYGAAERELRRALADNPPPAVVASVDTALRGIRSNRRLFGSISGGLAPDTNIN